MDGIASSVTNRMAALGAIPITEATQTKVPPHTQWMCDPRAQGLLVRPKGCEEGTVLYTGFSEKNEIYMR